MNNTTQTTINEEIAQQTRNLAALNGEYNTYRADGDGDAVKTRMMEDELGEIRNTIKTLKWVKRISR